tara:strand:+ start:66 stop:707 length:642 start_codon:yes stop_codon:yes gene_type:complete
MKKTLIIACDGEAASGKSTGAKLVSKKYKLLLINSGLYYRYATKLYLQFKPKQLIPFLRKKLKSISYKKISKMNLHSQEISKNVSKIAKQKNVRIIINNIQKKLIKQKKHICLEGRDIASKILKKDPKYDVAFYFTCNLNIASRRRWVDLKKKVNLSEVKKSLKHRTEIDKKRKHSPLIRVKDAILIQTDKLNKMQVLKKMSLHIDKKLKVGN